MISYPEKFRWPCEAELLKNTVKLDSFGRQTDAHFG